MDKILNTIKKLMPVKLFKILQPGYHYTLSWLSALIYRWPSESLIVIGVTGTTGKTTSICLIAKMLESAGYKVGFTSTAIFNNGVKEWLNDKKMTMIGRLFTQKILRQMVRNGCQYAIIETTSEGITQHRHRFINYDILVLTGLYPEHIEAHGNFANYQQAKGQLFQHLRHGKKKYVDNKRKVMRGISGLKKIELTPVKKTIIVNGDDEHKDYFLDFWAEEKIIYTADESVKKAARDKIKVVFYSDIEADAAGLSFKVGETKFNLPLLGKFNAQNSMAAVTVGLSQEISLNKIKIGIEKIEEIAGRLEKIDEGQDFTVIVDYAFEPNAVAKLYETVKLIPHHKIIHVLGSAGGGRDIARRPKLGQLAGANADYIIITNEDPYDDDPLIIMDQVSLGAEQAGAKNETNLFKILDRTEAIKKALSLAQAGDIVLVTGKGSEQAICVANGEKIPWDDRAVIRGLLSADK